MTRGQNYGEMIAFFERNDFHFQAHPERPLVQMQMTGENGSWSFTAVCDDARDHFAAFSQAPLRVPAPKRPAAAEYLTRANYGLMIGNFELDYSDGEVRYKTAMDTDGIRLNDQLIGLTVSVNCRMMDRYLPGLMAVVYGDESPVEAVTKAEAAPGGASTSEIDAVVRQLIDVAAGSNPAESTEDSQAEEVPAPPVERLRRWINRGRG